MVTYYFVTDIVWEAVQELGYPDDWDPYKIQVGAYDDVAHTCYAYTEDDALWALLEADSKVTGILQSEYVSNIERLRPPPPDVDVRLKIVASAQDKTDLENFLVGKGWSYRIEER